MPEKPKSLARLTNAQPVVTTAVAIPRDVRDLLGPAPITRFESADLYERMLNQVAAAVQPRDYIEWAWVKDIVDLSWDAARSRRAKVALVGMRNRAAIETLWRAYYPSDVDEHPLMKSDLEANLEQLIAGEDPADTEDFNHVLKERMGLEPEAVDDVAYAIALPQIEKLERLIDNAMSRRDAILREIDRRRDSQACRAQSVAQDLDEAIDAEFE